ncbi:protein of unknown function [Candidatus Filomicrobium marinum]|uniref:Uncharacterized protein n=2 Tax=Filomicrobium TaxID=119044 RepID=A0A0D6JDN9_9HYPH|nr:protein of unknown function [Candidatus Filomicrobium marinum]CPR17252.1 protein of unknown function [Candidatus Filomicrobium marinum]SDO37154.1 hypothetical protein SAMN04488061_1019 [Filomicrobium insigne]
MTFQPIATMVRSSTQFDPDVGSFVTVREKMRAKLLALSEKAPNLRALRLIKLMSNNMLLGVCRLNLRLKGYV